MIGAPGICTARPSPGPGNSRSPRVSCVELCRKYDNMDTWQSPSPRAAFTTASPRSRTISSSATLESGKPRADLDRAERLVGEMREHAEDRSGLIASWIEAFDMVQNPDGSWSWGPFIERQNDLVGRYRDLVRAWNRMAAKYNAVVWPRNVGRPMAASEAQVAEVRKLHKAGRSLRWIAAETSLGLRTVRTVVERIDGRDRTTVKQLQRIDPDRKLEASWRARKRVRDGLPKRINDTLANGRELVKAAKGLGG